MLENDDSIYVSTLCPFSDMAIDDFSYVATFAKVSHGMVLTASDYIGYYDEKDEQYTEVDGNIVKLAKASVEYASSSTSKSTLDRNKTNSKLLYDASRIKK